MWMVLPHFSPNLSRLADLGVLGTGSANPQVQLNPITTFLSTCFQITKWFQGEETLISLRNPCHSISAGPPCRLTYVLTTQIRTISLLKLYCCLTLSLTLPAPLQRDHQADSQPHPPQRVLMLFTCGPFFLLVSKKGPEYSTRSTIPCCTFVWPWWLDLRWCCLHPVHALFANISALTFFPTLHPWVIALISMHASKDSLRL